MENGLVALGRQHAGQDAAEGGKGLVEGGVEVLDGGGVVADGREVVRELGGEGCDLGVGEVLE